MTAMCCLLAANGMLAAGDWPEWRGPNRDGTSAEKGLVEKWSLAGENLVWKAPYGGRRSGDLWEPPVPFESAGRAKRYKHGCSVLTQITAKCCGNSGGTST